MAGIAAPPAHPIDLIAGLAKGRVPWPEQSTVVAAVIAALLVATVVLVLILRTKSAGKKARVEKAARYLGKGKSLAAFSEKGAMATAERLGVKDTPGITVGRVVSTGQMFIQPWEDLSIDIWGPRTGKSTSRVMPFWMLPAPWSPPRTSAMSWTAPVLSQCDNLVSMKMATPRDLAEPASVFGYVPPGLLDHAMHFMKEAPWTRIRAARVLFSPSSLVLGVHSDDTGHRRRTTLPS